MMSPINSIVADVAAIERSISPQPRIRTSEFRARIHMLAGSNHVRGWPHVAVCIDKSRVYGAGVLQGLADYMEVHGPWSVFLEPFGDGTLPWRRLDSWVGQGILALLCDGARARAAQLRLPIIDLCGNMPQSKLEEFGIPCVTSDHRAIGQLGAAHLLETGYSHFAFSGYRLFGGSRNVG